ncbi:MAG TPA: type VI secretion system baseplate subunit TssK, partial [Pirellulales bacterium]|nr:type VI secretion system baseplate subunit TssK [Pirellulales bacterium]
MRNLPVHWYEGVFLRPQHFQAADRFWTELIHTSQQWDHPYNYGLHSIEFSKEALANHQLHIHSLKARMRDGTLVSLGSDKEPDHIDLKQALPERAEPVSLEDAFGNEASLRVYLAMPKLQLGRANVGHANNGERPRFVEQD